jgi:hypothetical protein
VTDSAGCFVSPGRGESAQPQRDPWAARPELYGELAVIVEENVGSRPDDGSRAYWQAVYAALTGT